MSARTKPRGMPRDDRFRVFWDAESGAARVIFGGMLLFGVIGCLTHEIVRCPFDQAEMTKQILEIAPLSTPRDEALRRLKAAGIRGDFEFSKSEYKDYFCCETWQRKNGEEWRVNMLLHFNKSGKLCEVLELPDLDTHRARPAKNERMGTKD